MNSLRFVALSVFVLGVSLAATGQEGPTTNSADRKKEAIEVKQPKDEPAEETISLEEAIAKLPPEVIAKGKEAKDKFVEVRSQLQESIIEMRATHIRYMNEDDRSPAAKERYWKHRNRTRQLMSELYDRALEVLLLVPDKESAEYVVTVIKYREEKDIYDLSTMRGGALLLEFGMTYPYVIRATARSSVAVGNFKIAKNLYESVDDKYMTDVDRALIRNGAKLEKQWEREQELRESDKAKEPLPQVKISTTRGDFVVELYVHQAPSTVANFISLCDRNFYDGLDFFQVVDSLLALTGDDTGRGIGNTGKFLKDECTREDARQPIAGSLVMAKQPIPGTSEFIPNSSSCQFAILYVPLPHILRQQTVFGRVIEGMDVVSSFRRVDPAKKKKKGAIQLPPDQILSTEVIRRPKQLPEIEYFDLEGALKDPHFLHDHGPGEHHDHEHGPGPAPPPAN